MTTPNTPGYVPPAGGAPGVAWDPDDHRYKPVPGMPGLAAAAANEPPALSVQEAVDALAAATTIASLRDAMLDLAEALTGAVPGGEPAAS